MRPGFYGDLDTRWLTLAEKKARGLNPKKSYVMLLAPLYYQPLNGPLIMIPVGFITDFASVPRILWSIFPPYDPFYGAPAVLHDYLYTLLGIIPGYPIRFTRAESDALFLEAMSLQGTEEWRSLCLYHGVRLGGWMKWRRQTSLRDSKSTAKISTAVV